MLHCNACGTGVMPLFLIRLNLAFACSVSLMFVFTCCLSSLFGCQVVLIRQAVQAAVAERAAMQRETAARRDLLRSQQQGGGGGGGVELRGGGGRNKAKEALKAENEDFIGGEDDTQALIMKYEGMGIALWLIYLASFTPSNCEFLICSLHQGMCTGTAGIRSV